MRTIWMCEDREDPAESMFGETKRDAERRCSGNRGYDYYTGSFKQCVEDGWCKPAVKIKVPSAAYHVLIFHCQI
jgi:hypothetical protein